MKIINPRQDVPSARATVFSSNDGNIKNKATKFNKVARGQTPGIYHRCIECEMQIKGCSRGCYKGFNSIDQATEFMELYSQDTMQESETLSATCENLPHTEALPSFLQHLALASVDAINKIATIDK